MYLRFLVGNSSLVQKQTCTVKPKRIEYKLVEFRKSLGMNFFSPFQPERECTNHVNVHKLYAVEYINTECSLDYPFQF